MRVIFQAVLPWHIEDKPSYQSGRLVPERYRCLSRCRPRTGLPLIYMSSTALPLGRSLASIDRGVVYIKGRFSPGLFFFSACPQASPDLAGAAIAATSCPHSCSPFRFPKMAPKPAPAPAYTAIVGIQDGLDANKDDALRKVPVRMELDEWC